MAQRAATPFWSKAVNFTHVQWSGLLNGDTGEGVDLNLFGQGGCSLQISGTLGAGGAIQLEGSNDPVDDPAKVTNWNLLGSSITALGIQIYPNDLTRFVRPRVTGGDGTTNLTATLGARSPRI